MITVLPRLADLERVRDTIPLVHSIANYNRQPCSRWARRR
jgi:hypothetical protein